MSLPINDALTINEAFFAYGVFTYILIDVADSIFGDEEPFATINGIILTFNQFADVLNLKPYVYSGQTVYVTWGQGHFHVGFAEGEEGNEKRVYHTAKVLHHLAKFCDSHLPPKATIMGRLCKYQGGTAAQAS